jgi:hypothetical protein
MCIGNRLDCADGCILLQDCDKEAHTNVVSWSKERVWIFMIEWASQESESSTFPIKLTKKAFQLTGVNLHSISRIAMQELFTPDSLNLCQVLFHHIHPSDLCLLHSKTEIRTLQESFGAEFKDDNNVVQTVIGYAEQCLAYYQKHLHDFISPYVALIQSSGTGKSRLTREMARVCPTMYVCMRKRSTGYPERSELAIDVLFSGLNMMSELDAEHELARRLGWCESNANLFLKKSEGGVDPRFESERLASTVWKLPECALDRNAFELLEKSTVFLVIDEAKELLDEDNGLDLESSIRISTFRLLRRALARHHFDHRSSKLVMILLDTMSKIQNFAPSSGSEVSSRKMKDEPGSRLLFAPIILHGFHDSQFSEPAPGLRNLSDCSFWDSNEYLKAGRPLLSFHSVDEKSDVDFLLRKLKGGGTAPSRQGLLSLTVCRLAVSINHFHACASELVAENMATILATDLDRESMLVTYLAEPKLAIAAAGYWDSDELVKSLLPHLQQAMITGAVSAGTRGEIVAQIVLLLAFDKACQQQKPIAKHAGSTVNLSDVIVQLLPVHCDSDTVLNDVIPHSLRKAKIACAQFIKLGEKVGPDTIVRLAARHCGASFRDNQRGCDLFVPIMAELLAVLHIQVKNWRDQEKACVPSGNCCINMLPSIALVDDKFDTAELAELDQNCVRLYFQIGASTPSVTSSDVRAGKDLPIHSASAKPIQIFGLGARCLSEEQKSFLRVLADTDRGLDTYLNLQKKNRLATEHNAMPDPVSLQRIRKELPFVIDRNPKWQYMSEASMRMHCDSLGIPKSVKSKSAMESALTARSPNFTELFPDVPM